MDNRHQVAPLILLSELKDLNIDHENVSRRKKIPLADIEEIIYPAWSGYCMLFISILLSPTIIVPIFICKGLFTLSPNESAVITLFGKYKGTVKEAGYYFVNPFCTISIVSLKLNNHYGETLQVNDKRGNPIEISLVLVYRIINPVAAIFHCQNFYTYIKLQSEAALRFLATSYAYDHSGEENEITLLHGSDTVNNFLLDELNDRLHQTGILVIEARITHLKYSNIIQNVMLKRQQADTVIAARKKIVEVASKTIQETIFELGKDAKFSEELKSSLASNLLVILCSETQTKPLLHLSNKK